VGGAPPDQNTSMRHAAELRRQFRGELEQPFAIHNGDAGAASCDQTSDGELVEGVRLLR
jgi:hypothetical protein